MFATVDGATNSKITARLKKFKVVALVKWLSKKGVEKIQEEH